MDIISIPTTAAARCGGPRSRPRRALSGLLVLSLLGWGGAQGRIWAENSPLDCYEKSTCGKTPLKLLAVTGGSSSNAAYQCRVDAPTDEAVKFRFEGTLVSDGLTKVKEEGVANVPFPDPTAGKFHGTTTFCGRIFKKSKTGAFLLFTVPDTDLFGNPVPGAPPVSVGCGQVLKGAECKKAGA